MFVLRVFKKNNYRSISRMLLFPSLSDLRISHNTAKNIKYYGLKITITVFVSLIKPCTLRLRLRIDMKT